MARLEYADSAGELGTTGHRCLCKLSGPISPKPPGVFFVEHFAIRLAQMGRNLTRALDRLCGVRVDGAEGVSVMTR